MGTRSVVGRWVGDEAWIGRYVHYDGYPANMVMVLLENVLKHGFNNAVSTLVFENKGWSGLYTEPHKDIKTGVPDLENYVDGYGYVMGGNMELDDNWIMWDGDNWGTEYAYIIEPSDKSVTIFDWDYGLKKWHKSDVIDFGPALERIKNNQSTIEDEVSRRWQTLSVLEGVS